MSTELWARIGRQIGSKWNYISPVQVKVHLNGGLPYESLDSTGTCIRPSSILQITELLRIGSYLGERDFMDLKRLGCLIFIATASVNVNKDFYKDSVVKFDCALDSVLTFSYFGRSSFRLDTAFWHPDFSEPIIQSDVQSVILDAASRRPMRFPDWYREKYEPLCMGGQTLVKPPLGDMLLDPQNDTSNIVQFRDLDVYRHTNWSSYVTMCQNSLAEGIANNKYKHITDDTMRSGLQRFSVAYKKESRYGDRLVIHSREEGERTVHFRVSRGDDVCVETTFEF